MKNGLLALPCAVVAIAALAQQSVPGGDWPSYNNKLNGQRFSPLKQIDASNVERLGQVCRVQIDGPNSFHAGLVVQDGTIYTATSTATVALDATDCQLRWKFDYRPEEQQCGGSNRGVALLDGRLFRGTCDGRLVALDAATGKLLWKNAIAQPEHRESTTAAPLAWGGVVFMGISGSESGGRGRVLAYDAATGRELWRFNTVPMGDEPGAGTWKNAASARFGGGSVWGAMSLDISTGELFVPVGNPWPGIDKGYRPGDNLYTNSIVVLDARTGALKWWYQTAPADWMDLDLAAAPALYRDAASRDLMAIAGKDGYVTVVDRTTRKRVFRTAVTTVNPIPENPSKQGLRMCPGYAGGVEWNGAAMDRANNQLITGAVDMCFIVTLVPEKDYPGGRQVFGGTVVPDGPDTGWITAVDAVTGEVRWKYHAEKPVVAGITPTASGITFAGDLAGNFLVFDSKDGRLLRKLPAGGGMAGGLVTYDIAGRQYVAYASGNVSRMGFNAPGMPSVVIMALDAKDPVVRDATTAASDAALGERLYRQVCQSCHGPDGNMIADHKLSNLAARRDLPATIDAIRNPKAPMPVLYPALLDERSVNAVAAWVHAELR